MSIETIKDMIASDYQHILRDNESYSEYEALRARYQQERKRTERSNRVNSSK